MFGIDYLKTAPTQYVLHYSQGRRRHAGAGLSFFYFKPTSAIVLVPISSADAPFIFNEMTADFQPVTLQGQLTYRIEAPEAVAVLLDYRVDGSAGRYLSEDPQKLPLRLVNHVQVLTRAEVQKLPLEKALYASDELVAAVLARLAAPESPLLSMGVRVVALSIQAVKPTPEMARALEAEAREALLRQADEAIYTRRNAAIEQERRIKENELNTEIAVEEKKRQIREAKVEADRGVETKEQQVRELKLAGQIRLEEERKRLVAARGENARAEADLQSYAIEASLRPLQALDADLLQLLSVQSVEPRLMVSMALKEIARNAAKIGNLNITPDVLESLMRKTEK